MLLGVEEVLALAGVAASPGCRSLAGVQSSNALGFSEFPRLQCSSAKIRSRSRATKSIPVADGGRASPLRYAGIDNYAMYVNAAYTHISN